MNRFGTRFTLTTYGESHGLAIGGVVDGCPAGIVFDGNMIVNEMLRRHIGAGATKRCEADTVEILSGVFEGHTLGTPIAFEIRNQDANSSDYDELRELYRPGHADYTYAMHYGIRDHRGGGRASGRETAARVVGGAIAKMILREKGISINGGVLHLAESNNDNDDTKGGVIECTITGVPAGIGDPVFDKLNARLAAAMMSIPSAIGFEMGAGFAAAKMCGSEYRDEWNGCSSAITKTNHCGGIQGGISNGMPIVFRTAFHPVVTNNKPTECMAVDGTLHLWQPKGRHDSCHIPRTVVVVEAMAAMTIVDLLN